MGKSLHLPFSYFAFHSLYSAAALDMALRPLLRRCSRPVQAADALRTSFLFGVRGFASGGEQMVSLRSQHSTCNIQMQTIYASDHMLTTPGTSG